jgi:hypothetical protein
VKRAIEHAKEEIRWIKERDREWANYVPGMTAPKGWFPFRVPEPTLPPQAVLDALVGFLLEWDDDSEDD